MERESVLCKYDVADEWVTNHEVGAARCGWKERMRHAFLWKECKS